MGSAKKMKTSLGSKPGIMAEVTPWQCPSSAPVPAQGTPGGSGQLGTPRAKLSHWAPSHCLGCFG
eukprot:scaffold68417_cov45-Phaeocystis_antarctica.AAC.1